MEDKELIIVVDVQAAFPIPPKVVADIEAYSKTFRRRIFTKFLNPPDSLFRTALHRDACAPGSPDLRLLIPPSADDWVFNKASYGLSPHHLRRIQKLRVKKADICGVDTDACVLGVMFSLFDAGILPKVRPNLCWSSQELDYEALRIMQTQFGLKNLVRSRKT